MGSSVQNVHWCRCRVRFNRPSEEGCGEGPGEGPEPGKVQQGSGDGWRRPGSVLKKVLEKIPGRFGRFNQVPGRFGQVHRVPVKIPKMVWAALVQSQVRFNRVPERVAEKVRRRSALVQSQVRFNKVPEKVRKALVPWCRARSSLTRFGESFGKGSGEGLGGFGAARSGSTGFRRKFQRGFRDALVQSQVRFNRVPERVAEKVRRRSALVQSQVRFNKVPRRFGRLWCLGAEPGQVWRGSEKVPEKVPEKIWAALVQPGSGSTGFRRFPEKVLEGADPGQGQKGSGEGSGESSRKPWCTAKSSSADSGDGCRSQAGSGSLNSRTLSRGVSRAGFAARFRQICDNQMLLLLGIDTTEVYFLREPTSTLAQKAIVRAEQSQQQDVERETPPKKRMAKASNKWNDPAEQDAEKKMQKKESQKERERDLPSGAPGTVFIEHTRLCNSVESLIPQHFVDWVRVRGFVTTLSLELTSAGFSGMVVACRWCRCLCKATHTILLR